MATTTPHPRRTWVQRATIASLFVVSIVCFVAAGTLAVGQWVVSSRNLVVLDDAPGDALAASGAGGIVVPGETAALADEGVETTPPPTFPEAEPDAKNFLITGADNGACVDPDSPYAPAFGDRSDFGERSDTIMVWRVNPSTGQVAVLSFPRDLYVTVAGGSKARINSAYRRDDPNRLRDTIFLNFGIPVDHYVQVDFCAFKRLVDGVGGVSVPFLYPARDPNTGLLVPASGGECFEFDGDHALAYVRSRKYQYEDPPGSGEWRTDGTSDLGRISRQQDFLRRTVAKVLANGFDPGTASALIDTNREYLTTDSELTPARMLEFAGVLRSLDANEIASYQIESSPQNVAGQSVLTPRIEGDNMRAILSVFRGEATLESAPDQEFASTTSAVPRPGVTTTSTSTTSTSVPTTEPDTSDATSESTLPTVVAEENPLGITPPRDIAC